MFANHIFDSCLEYTKNSHDSKEQLSNWKMGKRPIEKDIQMGNEKMFNKQALSKK
jgi:hypothetical protein